MQISPDLLAKWREYGSKQPEARAMLTPDEWKQLLDLALIGWYLINNKDQKL